MKILNSESKTIIQKVRFENNAKINGCFLSIMYFIQYILCMFILRTCTTLIFYVTVYIIKLNVIYLIYFYILICCLIYKIKIYFTEFSRY